MTTEKISDEDRRRLAKHGGVSGNFPLHASYELTEVHRAHSYDSVFIASALKINLNLRTQDTNQLAMLDRGTALLFSAGHPIPSASGHFGRE